MSSLKAVYQDFLAKPRADALSNHAASLNYITTLTTITPAAAIVKHVAAHQQVLKKKEEKVLSAIEGQGALCLDVETTLEFITGGGAYLPGLDDNFLADRVVTFPMIHIVQFDANQKIQTIRLYWDQGSLLKLVDVIGSRARNWPIRDGKDQARLIASSSAVSSQNNGPARTDASNGLPDQNENSAINKPKTSSKNVTGDPHASLSLFAPQDTNRETSHHPTAVAPRVSAKPPPRDYQDLFASSESDSLPAADVRASSPQKGGKGSKAQSAKPPPRDYHDLFVGNESDASPAAKSKQLSPQKENRPITPGAIAPKGGSGKNFQPSRLFENDSSQPGTPGTPAEGKFIKPDPNKYNHFELGEGNEDATTARPIPTRPKTKHQTQWDFEDFMTPEKVTQKIRGQDVRHFGWSDDEPNMESPVKQPKVHQPRPDARQHFEFQDDGTPAGDRRPAGHPRGQGAIKGIGLYKNDLFNAAERSPERSPERKSHPLATVTNVKDRRKDFDPHFTMNDSPVDTGANGGTKPVPEARTKAVKMMDAQWEATDHSPGAPSQHQHLNHHDHDRPASRDQENFAGADRHVGVKSGGDGMGGKKGAGRSWGFGDESDEDGEGGVNGGKFQAVKRQQAPVDHTVWDF